jgi:hypothetical protein
MRLFTELALFVAERVRTCAVIPFLGLSRLLSAHVVVCGGRRRVEKFGPTRGDERGIIMSARNLASASFDGSTWAFADGSTWAFADGSTWAFADGSTWAFADGSTWA